MRSNAQEMQAAARRIASQLNRAAGPVHLLLPLGGLSMLDAPGQPFHDPQANAAFFETLRQHFAVTDTHHLSMLPCHLNDPAFARALVDALRAVLGMK